MVLGLFLSFVPIHSKLKKLVSVYALKLRALIGSSTYSFVMKWGRQAFHLRTSRVDLASVGHRHFVCYFWRRRAPTIDWTAGLLHSALFVELNFIAHSTTQRRPGLNYMYVSNHTINMKMGLDYEIPG